MLTQLPVIGYGLAALAFLVLTLLLLTSWQGRLHGETGAREGRGDRDEHGGPPHDPTPFRTGTSPPPSSSR